MKIDFTVKTKKTFSEAVNDVIVETEKAGFKVLYVHNIQQTIGKKGYKIEPLKIIEICNAKNAYNAIQKDIKLTLCLPCKINVYEQSGKTYISGMRPIILSQFFPNADHLGDLPKEIDAVIRAIIEKAK